jgi:TonB family protein
VIIITTKDAEVMLSPREAKNAAEISGPNHKGDEVFFIVEDMPSFPGGKAALKKYIYSNLEYPEDAKKKGITGEVQVLFTVTASGRLENIKVVRSAYAGFDKPAMQVFENMPDWNPGRQRGKPVRVNVVVPVKFNTDTE